MNYDGDIILIGTDELPMYAMRRWILGMIVLGLAGCASGPAIKPPPLESGQTAKVVDYALSLQGAPYRPGKASPEEGFDCSGFIAHVYRTHGVPLPRTSRDMALTLPTVEPRQRRPGDLLFFDTGGKPYSHVGLYVGDNRFVHAPSSRTGRVMVSNLYQPYWWQRFTGVRRPPAGERTSLSSLQTRVIP